MVTTQPSNPPKYFLFETPTPSSHQPFYQEIVVSMPEWSKQWCIFSVLFSKFSKVYGLERRVWARVPCRQQGVAVLTLETHALKIASKQGNALQVKYIRRKSHGILVCPLHSFFCLLKTLMVERKKNVQGKIWSEWVEQGGMLGASFRPQNWLVFSFKVGGWYSYHLVNYESPLILACC